MEVKFKKNEISKKDIIEDGILRYRMRGVSMNSFLRHFVLSGPGPSKMCFSASRAQMLMF